MMKIYTQPHGRADERRLIGAIDPTVFERAGANADELTLIILAASGVDPDQVLACDCITASDGELAMLLVTRSQQ